MSSRASAATSAFTSVDGTQTSAPRRSGARGVTARRAELVEAVVQERVQLAHVRLGLGDPDLLHQLDARDRRVDRRDRRRARLEAARGRRGRVVVDVHLEDVAVGEPAGRVGSTSCTSVAAAVEEPEPGRPEQVLEDAGGEEVEAERARRRPGASRSSGRRRRGRARRARARSAPTASTSSRLAVAEADVRDRDERGLLVDRAPRSARAGSSRRPRPGRARRAPRAAPARARSGRSSGTRSR